MRAEYDFSNAVRGKYRKRYLAGSNVVVLDPDVAATFKNATAVDELLAHHGADLIQPHGRECLPHPEFLAWHRAEVFKEPARE